MPKMTKKTTPWFERGVPCRTGVYQRQYRAFAYRERILYCLWDGSEWHIGTERASDAPSTEVSISQNLPWRGLLEPS